MSHFTTSASITEYWQGMMSVLLDVLMWMSLRIYWCPRHYEFRNYSGVAYWYTHSQLISGQFEYFPLQFKCFHHRVLTRIEVSFGRFPDMDPSKNILMPTPLWVQELQRSGLLVYALAIGFCTVCVCPPSIQVLMFIVYGQLQLGIFSLHTFWYY